MINEPERPKNMPLDAIWDEKEQEWYLGATLNGKSVGLWKWWHKNGYFWAETEYDNKGKILWYKRYHPDGTLALSGEAYTPSGNLKGITVMVKCKVKTPEDFYDMFGAKHAGDEAVWKIISVRADDGERIKQYIYDENGKMSRSPWYHDKLRTTYAAYITEEDNAFLLETEKKQKEIEDFMSGFEKEIKKHVSKYTSVTKRVKSGDAETIAIEEAVEKYNLPDIEYLTDGNDAVVLILKNDAIIDGDFLTEHEEEICGIYALGNLTFTGSIVGDWDYMWMYVLGNLKADNIIIGDGVVEVLKDIEVNNCVMKILGEGSLVGHGSISASVVISDLPQEVRGKIIKGTVVDTSDDKKFNTKLRQYTCEDMNEVIIPQLLEAEEDEDEDEDESCYSIDGKKAAIIVRCGKSILL